MKTAYLSGPMRSIPYFNAPLFYKVAGELRRSGWEVFSPAEHDGETFDPMTCPLGLESEVPGFDVRKALTWDFTVIMSSDAIICLPGWEHSTGCHWELVVAYATGKSLWEYAGYKAGKVLGEYDGVILSRIDPPAVVTDPVNCGRRYGR